MIICLCCGHRAPSGPDLVRFESTQLTENTFLLCCNALRLLGLQDAGSDVGSLLCPVSKVQD